MHPHGSFGRNDAVQLLTDVHVLIRRRATLQVERKAWFHESLYHGCFRPASVGNLFDDANARSRWVADTNRRH